MKYMGSKSRIAKDIVPIIQRYIDETGATVYFEPMVGGANIIDKIKCQTRVGNDINPYLIALLSHVQRGGILPDKVSKELYDEMRTQYNKISSGEIECSLDEKLQMWMIGAAGFLASYNGRFFDGGYAKPGYEKTKNGLRYRDYYQEAKANLLSQIEGLQGVTFICNNYREIPLHLAKNMVIYVDPPYKNTKEYLNSRNFDYTEFWEVMRKWSKYNIVIISELDAPDDFECIWSKEVKRSINAGGHRANSNEKLFMLKKED